MAARLLSNLWNGSNTVNKKKNLDGFQKDRLDFLILSHSRLPSYTPVSSVLIFATWLCDAVISRKRAQNCQTQGENALEPLDGRKYQLSSGQLKLKRGKWINHKNIKGGVRATYIPLSLTHFSSDFIITSGLLSAPEVIDGREGTSPC